VRTVVIGDIHGCLNEAIELVRRCGEEPDTRLVLVGDLVAKGPDSAGVVQWAREIGAHAVLGNHDAHALRLRPGAPDAPERPRPEHLAVAQALRPADWAWLGARPLWSWLDGADAGVAGTRTHIVVHAGLVPGVALEDQDRDNLLNLRSITPAGEPSKRVDGTPWASLWRGPPHVVFGHDAVRGLQRYDGATGLDTGCVYGRELTALVLPEGRLVAVPARRAYAPMKR
jgi:hypothetical protein